MRSAKECLIESRKPSKATLPLDFPNRHMYIIMNEPRNGSAKRKRVRERRVSILFGTPKTLHITAHASENTTEYTLITAEGLVGSGLFLGFDEALRLR